MKMEEWFKRLEENWACSSVVDSVEEYLPSLHKALL